MRTLVVVALLVGFAVTASSQQVPNQTRAQEVAAAFTKNKHVVKEKFGVRIEKYKDIRSEPVVKPNIRDYSGVYEVEGLSYVINIQVGADGKIEANGVNTEPSRTFRLENARIDGAVLTASKVYQDGTTERFEGVFLKQTERNSPSDAGVTKFGLGVVLSTPVQFGGITLDKLFYQLK